MADTADSSVKILIEMGLVGADQADLAKHKLQEVAKAARAFTEAQSGLIRFSKEQISAAEAARKQAEEMVGVIRVTKEDVKASEEGIEATSRFEISKRELSESIRGLTRQFPLLGEAVKLAFSPMTLMIGGPILAFEALSKAVELVTNDLTEVIMPDFEIETVDAATAAWRGLAAARREANEAFNAPDAQYQRAVENLKAQLAAAKELFEVEKQRALARLELAKGGMSAEDYEARKSVINQVYATKETAATRAEAQQELARKYEEQTNAQAAANVAAAKARGDLPLSPEEQTAAGVPTLIKLPGDKVVGEQVAELQKRSDAAQQEIEKRKAALEFINQVETEQSDDKYSAQSVKDWLTFAATYGSNASGEDARKIERPALDTAVQNKAGVDANIERINREKAERDRLEKVAQDNQTKADQLAKELPVDAAAWAAKNAAQDQTEAIKRLTEALNRFHASGETPGQATAEGAAAVADLAGLNARGQTVAGVNAAAAGARGRQAAGVPLTAQDQADLALQARIEQDLAAKQRLEDLATASGLSSQEIVKLLAEMARAHHDLRAEVAALAGAFQRGLNNQSSQTSEVVLNHQ